MKKIDNQLFALDLINKKFINKIKKMKIMNNKIYQQNNSQNHHNKIIKKIRIKD